jgi:hypothetical protein
MAEKFKINLKPIIGSFVFGLIIWFMVATEKTYSHQIKVPIKIIRLAAGKTLLEPIPEYAILEVQAKGRSLIAIWFYDVSFNLELPNIKRSQKINLKDYLTFLDLPATFGFSVLDIIEPGLIDLQIDDLVNRELPVMLSGKIQPEDGYILMNYTFDFDTAIVSGPRSKVEAIHSIFSENLESIGKRSSFTQDINLVNPMPGIIGINPETVRLEADVQRLVELIIYKIPIKIQDVPANFEATAIPAELALKVKGGEKLVAALDTSLIKAEINFKKSYRADREKYAVSIKTPENITWIESIPERFTIQVKKR